MKAYDNGGFPGIVYTCKLNYAQTAQYVTGRYIHVGHFIIQSAIYCAEILCPHSAVACVYFRIGCLSRVLCTTGLYLCSPGWSSQTYLSLSLV